MESHLSLALCSLEITQNQVKDQSKQIERLTSTYNDQSQQLSDQSKQIDSLMTKDMNQSQKIERLMSSLNDQSQQIASLTSTVQGLEQQIERLKGQDRYQAMQVNKMTNEAKGGTNKKGATNVMVKEGNNMEQGFKPKSINDIEVGMKVLFESTWFAGIFRGTVKYIGPLSVFIGSILICILIFKIRSDRVYNSCSGLITAQDIN
ncbi:uncharacterized protein LOC111346435 [Stylophora pistillata]|uniref:Uncharacterized protein n=1 Tax=Stylophora pistillata TaxID=50429 RepID=A0A2B4R9Z4_STYPI|nr:uncharacterized protein LOC111346435 [Stylophora pistillata]PFX13105.1 hypothetical protein AWC38_SpisGene22837 [Stylophora pistillata]